jgi:hypothetical protein
MRLYRQISSASLGISEPASSSQEARRDWRSHAGPGKAAITPALNLEVEEVEVEKVTVS